MLRARDGKTIVERAGVTTEKAEEFVDVLRRMMADFSSPFVPELPRFTGGAVGLPQLRHGGVVRARHAAARTAQPDPALQRRSRVHDLRYGAGVRSRAASHSDHRERAHHARRRPRSAVSVCVHEDRFSRARAAPRSVASASQAGHEHRREVERAARALSGDGENREGIHRRRRYLPGRAVAALRGGDHGRSVHGLSRAPAREPVAVHVLPAHGEGVDRRIVARDARAGRRRHGADASDRGNAAARARATKKTRGLPKS